MMPTASIICSVCFFSLNAADGFLAGFIICINQLHKQSYSSHI
jgi:hypothetical protein